MKSVLGILLFFFSFLFFFSEGFAQPIDTLANNKLVWQHPVQGNEQLPKIAQFYGLSVQELKAANGMTSNIINRETLQIPLSTGKGSDGGVKLHRVKANESLHNIAQQYDTDIVRIKDLNQYYQNMVPEGTYMLIPNLPSLPDKPVEGSRLTQQGFFSLGFFAGNDWEGNTNINYSINGRYRLKHQYFNRDFKVRTEFFGNLGFRHDIGKFFSKRIDRFEARTQAEYQVNEYITQFVFGAFRTQLFETYFKRVNSEDVLTSTFLSPAYARMSIGAVFGNDMYTINLGLYQFKLTMVLNESVYNNRDYAYGVPRGDHTLLEHGVSVRGNVNYIKDKSLSVLANFDVFFTPYAVDIDLQSEISFRFSKRIKVSMLTTLMMDKDISDKVQFQNQILTGYTFRR